jgi:hypothetical protein
MNPVMNQLAKIPWDKLEVASGKGGHVPSALLGLTSPNENARNSSYWRLDNEVVCQSDLYEAAYFTVPFLIAMLRDSVPHGRERIYDLVYEIANGSAPAEVMVQSPNGIRMPLKDACAEEILKGMDVFTRDVSDPDPRISKRATDLLDLLKDDGE